MVRNFIVFLLGEYTPVVDLGVGDRDDSAQMLWPLLGLDSQSPALLPLLVTQIRRYLMWLFSSNLTAQGVEALPRL